MEGRPHGIAGGGQMQIGSTNTDIGIDAIDAVSMGMVPVITELIGDIQCNQDKTGQTDRQANNIDEGECSVFEQISPAEFEIIFDHFVFLILFILQSITHPPKYYSSLKELTGLALFYLYQFSSLCYKFL